MVLCGTKTGSSMASLEEPFEAPLFLRVSMTVLVHLKKVHCKNAKLKVLSLFKKSFEVHLFWCVENFTFL